MSKKSIAITLALASFTTGCATQLLSDERLRVNTAGALGTSPDELVITERREQLPNTFYTAKTKSGKVYLCTVNGGSLLAAGMVNAPQCALK